MTREEYIKTLIVDKGYSVKSFSQAVNIPYSTLRSILEAGVGGASVDNVIKICKGLGISVDSLNKCGASVNSLELSEHEKQLIIAYRSQPSLQLAVDRTLGISEEDNDADKKKKRA